MKRKIISVLLVLALVLSFSLVTAVPVAAQATLNVYPLTLSVKGAGSSTWSTTQAHTGSYSVHLDSGTTTTGDEGRIVIDMPSGMTLSDLTSISWWVYAVSGYPPHLDITIDCDGDTVVDPEDMLTAEMNLNCVGAPKSIATLTGEISYSTWLQTFELTSSDGFGAITDSTTFWVTKMGSGDLNAPSGTLAQWKAGTVANDPESEMTTPVIDGTAELVKLEIEVDNWVVNSDSYVDDITINGVVWYGNIQDAIDSASAGDTIMVTAGTHSVTAATNANLANLTISGASATTTIVDGSGKDASIVDGADVLFNVTASGVTIEDMTIDLGDDTTDFDVGVFTPNGGGINDLTVQNCTLLYAASGLTPGEQLIHLGGGSGATITGNTFDVASSNSMIYVGENVAGGDNDLLTVSNNTAAPVASTAGGAGDMDGGGTFFNQFGPVTNSTISGNTFTDTGIAVYLGSGSLAATDNVSVTGNTFTSTATGAIIITSEVDGVATGNITVTNNTFTGSTGGYGAISIFDTVITTADVDGSTISINNNNFAGDNTGGGVVVGAGVSGTPVDATDNWWGDASGPKQATTNPCASGDEASDNVNYTPWLDATYPGGSERDHNVENITQVTTHNSIQSAIDAANPDDTINVAAGTYSVTSVINVNLANLIISGASATTTIVDGSGKNASIVDGADVLFNVTASGVTIEDMTIDLGDDTTDFDVGVLTPNGGGIDDLTVQNCTLLYAAFGNDPGEQLIHLGGGTGATITGNAFDVATGNSMIYVGEDVANGDNDLLTVSNNTAAPVASTAGGAGDTDGGGTFFNQFGPLTNSTISGNTFTDTGIAVYLGSGSLAATDNVSVTSNTFNSTATGAIMITSEVDGVATGNIMVTNNTFTGSTGGYGAISIFDWDPTTADVDGSTITINNNNFAGDNTGGGVVVGAGVSGTPVDATMNWWGDISGPTHTSNPSGTGDAVSDYVDFTPWLYPPPAPPPPPPPPPTIETELFDTEASFETNSDGEIQETIVATSEDGNLTITIEAGTIALLEGEPLETLTAAVEPSPPEPPADAYLIGAYDFGPDGATFDPAITLTWSYDPETLPEDVDLVISYYDEVNEEWVWVPCEVDTENNIITASVAHFTTFAIITVPAELPPVVVPAAFIISSLGVSPSEVAPSEEVNISVLVANTGGESGNYTVVLKIDGVKEAEERVTVAAGGSQTVTFSVTKEEAGSYTITVDGLSSSFAVVPVVVPPEPAAFSVSYLSVSPRLEIEPGELVTISVLVANTGGESGSYTVVLKIDGVKEAEKSVTIAAGESQDVSFSVTREEAGSYTVAVDGLSGSFTVVAPPAKPGINWAMIGGIIAGVIVVGLLVFFFVRRRAY